MKTIGLIGGMSWESTAVYYDLLNKGARDSLGGLHSAEIVLRSLDFAEIEKAQKAGDWNAAGNILADAARALEKGGAECVVICANTMHKCADAVCAAV
ncbi:MAG: aspartate/glutamate racemase family protein, partial [Gammaproteobacteria bacterium]